MEWYGLWRTDDEHWIPPLDDDNAAMVWPTKELAEEAKVFHIEEYQFEPNEIEVRPLT